MNPGGGPALAKLPAVSSAAPIPDCFADQPPVAAEVAPFFSDLPERIAAAHLVVSRSGAGTVAELAAIGRPSILVPLPGAIDQDQFANAGVLAKVHGALRIAQAIQPRPAQR